jgi:Lrp/AsnC family transcriptional regulator, leucine-responsive regulatory protein
MLLDEICRLFGRHIAFIFLINANKKYHCSMPSHAQSDFPLDALDLALLEQLQTDASLSNQDLAKQVHVSPATCLRRVKRLRDAGLVERQVAILDLDRLAPLLGHGLQAVVEITLDRQGDEEQVAFQQRVIADDAVQQCYRVSPGPDYVLIVHARDMPDFLALTQRLFTSDANVRNVKTFFSIRRAKFDPRVPLGSD